MSFTLSQQIFESKLDNIANRKLLLSLSICNFNARSKNLYFSDKTTYEGNKVES